MSPKEFQLLRFLPSIPTRVHSRDGLLLEVWGQRTASSIRTVDTHIGWLRRKLEDNPRRPRLIQTVFGRGYRLSPADW